MKSFPNIDKLIELATTNPDELEKVRQQEIDDLIAGAPEHMQRRLRGLQFQIDCKRELHKDSPMGSCMAITHMMMDSLQHLNEVLHGYSRETKHSDIDDNKRVLAFPAASGN